LKCVQSLSTNHQMTSLKDMLRIGPYLPHPLAAIPNDGRVPVRGDLLIFNDPSRLLASSRTDQIRLN
jgi:hypothetical protein